MKNVMTEYKLAMSQGIQGHFFARKWISPEKSNSFLENEIKQWGGIDKIINDKIEDGVHGYYQDYNLLYALALNNWGCARKTYVEGMINGWYGIDKNIRKSKKLKKIWSL